ncbi:class F sortase [Streptomyces sp. 8N616]|uniref:class F sortase n=1 Tax=Streptomyces sp. 8N616 TaxID=3457414 RepID=UPI003FD3DDD0
MSGPRTPSRRAVRRGAGTVLALTAAALLVSGCAQQEQAPPRAVPPPPAPAQGAADDTGAEGGGAQEGDSGAEQEAGGQQKAQAMPSSPPERISIPSIKVSSSLVKLGRGEGGAMETPAEPAKAGWYAPGPTPGSVGPSVVAGHVTWNSEKAVFFRLSTLKAGDKVDVTRRDGRTAEFTVDRVEQYSKDRFPTTKVYGNVDHAGLRLITCAGTFSESEHRYADNIVVYASLTGSRG